MNCLDDVPFRMTASLVDDSVGEANFVQAPEFEMPNCEEVLMRAMVNKMMYCAFKKHFHCFYNIYHKQKSKHISF